MREDPRTRKISLSHPFGGIFSNTDSALDLTFLRQPVLKTICLAEKHTVSGFEN
jgi:hypothetical protein